MLQSCQGFAEDLQKTALHSQQGLLLSFLSLPSTFCLFRQGLGGPLCPRKGSGGQRLTVFSLKYSKTNINSLLIVFFLCVSQVFFVIMKTPDLEVVMKHLLAVQQIRASLAQITQVHLHRRDGGRNTEWVAAPVELLVLSLLMCSFPLDLPEHLGAVWAGETATPCRSLRAAAGNRLCDPPHPNMPGSAPFALRSDTEQERKIRMTTVNKENNNTHKKYWLL